MPTSAPTVRPLVAALAAAVALAGCAANRSQAEPLDQTEQFRPNAVRTQERPIGMLLAEIDRQVEQWSQLTLTARSESEHKQARGIELNLGRIAKPRVAELVEQLETGPPLNRIRAAAALGFTHDPIAQAPLLGALHDPLDAVINNALISLGTMQRPDTPLGEICEHARTHPDAQVRSNAYRALVWIVNAGGDEPCTLDAARAGLADPEPTVRTQAALLCGMLADEASVPRLSDQLYDDHALVARAAAEGLAAIANRSKTGRGSAARALVAALDRVEKDRRPIIRKQLVRVRESDLGDDPAAWVEWARNMP